MSNKRIRDIHSLIEALNRAIKEIQNLLEKESNVDWDHDHIGLLNSTTQLLEEIRIYPKDQSRRRNLGRLVMDNGGVDFPEALQNLLLGISTANLSE